MRWISPAKHFASEAVVCWAAIIKGLRLPFITTSNIGIPRSRIFKSRVISDISKLH